MRKFLNRVAEKIDVTLDVSSHGSGMVGRQLRVDNNAVKVESQLGEGGFASIYSVRDVGSRAAYALKHVRTNGDADAIADVRNEVAVMKQLRGHPNILTLHAWAFSGTQGPEDEAFLLLDLCSDTLVDAVRRAGGRLSPQQALAVFSDVCEGVAWMHNQPTPLAHRDIKAENVLLGPSRQWVLCDFGSSTTRAQVYSTERDRAMEEERVRKTTTPPYRAPEMWDLLMRWRVDTKVDVWALGCLLYYMLAGRLPFSGESGNPAINGRYEALQGPNAPAPLAMLVDRMLTVDPSARPDVEEVLDTLRALREGGLNAAAAGAGASGSSSSTRAGTAFRPPSPASPSTGYAGATSAASQQGSAPVAVSSGPRSAVGTSLAAGLAATGSASAAGSRPHTPDPWSVDSAPHSRPHTPQQPGGTPPGAADFDPFGLASAAPAAGSAAGAGGSTHFFGTSTAAAAAAEATPSAMGAVQQQRNGGGMGAFRSGGGDSWSDPVPPDASAGLEAGFESDAGFGSTSAFSTPTFRKQQPGQQHQPGHLPAAAATPMTAGPTVSRPNAYRGSVSKAFVPGASAHSGGTSRGNGSSRNGAFPDIVPQPPASAPPKSQQQQQQPAQQRRASAPPQQQALVSVFQQQQQQPPAKGLHASSSGSNISGAGAPSSSVHIKASGAAVAQPGAPRGLLPIGQADGGTRDRKAANMDPFAKFTDGLLPPKKVVPEHQPMGSRKASGTPSAFNLLPQPRSDGAGGLWRTVSDPPPVDHWVADSKY